MRNESELNARELEFLSIVKEKVNNIMGIDSILKANAVDDPLTKRAVKEWIIAKENLISHIMKHASVSNYSTFTLDSYIRSLENAIQFDLGVPLDARTAWKSNNPRRFLAGAKAINRLIHLQNTRWGKKLNVWERAFLPVRMFAWRLDPIGNISRYIEDVTSILENSRNSSAKYKDMYNNIMSDYRTNVNNAVESMKIVTKKDIIDFLKVNDVNGREVEFLGSEEVNGLTKHRIRVDGSVEVVDGSAIPFSRIKDALKDKYVNEFVNDMMHGQARYIRWKNEPSDEHKKQIKAILDDLKLKIEKGDEKDTVSGLPDIHTMDLSGGITINYVILKDQVGRIPGAAETYSAYIINHKSGNQKINYYSDRLTKSNREQFIDVENNSQLKEGFYKTNDFRTYGKRIFVNSETGERFIPEDDSKYSGRYRGWDFSDLNNKSIIVNPDISGTFTKIGKFSGERNTLFQTIAQLRRMYSKIGDEIYESSAEEFSKLNEWLKPNGRAQQLLYPVLGSENGKEFLNDLKTMFSVQNRIWIDKNGGIHTPNSNFLKLKDNYSPVMYDDTTRDNMLDDFIRLLSAEIASGNRPQSDVDMLNGFLLTKARIDNNQELADQLEQELNASANLDTKTILAQRNVYTKNRTEWTDPSLRRKDAGVHGDYVDNIFNNVHRNRLMITMLEALEQLASSGKNQFDLESAKWIVNRAKIAYADPSSYAGIGKFDFSYQRVADVLNKLPGKREWTAEGAQKLINNTRGMFAMTFLGATGAMVNRTQIVNEAIKYGWHAVLKSGKILAGKDSDITQDQALAIVNFLGIDEVTNMLIDFMAHGGEIELADAGLVTTPFGSIPTFSLKDYAVFVLANRRKYLKEGLPEVDKLLSTIEDNRLKTNKQVLAELEKRIKEKSSLKNYKARAVLNSMEKERNRLRNSLERKKVEQLREEFANLILTTEKDNNAKMLEARVKRLMGEISENRLKRMISWKLSWWHDGFAPELFTFTESERFMRRQSALIGLLAAASIGQLGDYNPRSGDQPMSRASYIDKNGNEKVVMVPSIFLTEKAKQIARNNVNNSMFGMSSLHLGEAFNGFGAQLFLYKAYPLQQMIHDWKIVQSFIDSSEGIKDIPSRLTKAFAQGLNRYKAGTKYTEVMADSNVDHEAIMALRFIGSRIGMTVASVAIESLSIFRPFLSSPIYREFSSMIRGGENPLFGASFRLLFNGLLWASMDEDDWFEGNIINVTWDFVRLFLPVFLTAPLYAFNEMFG